MAASKTYAEAHARSLADPEAFWGEAAESISWTEKYDRVLDDRHKPFYRWFAGGRINTCYNAVDLHVENGRGDQVAIIHDSPVTGSVRKIRYRELLDATSRFAGVLKAQGIEKGDRVLIYMPMVPESLIAMLACARIGAIHSVVFGGFAPNELAKRIDDAQPKVIVSASCGIEGEKVIPYKPLLDKAIEGVSRKPAACIVYQRPVPGYDVRILDEEGESVPSGQDGMVAIRLPLPPGCLSTLWNNDEKFLDYVRPFPNYYVTGDSGHFDEDGYLFIMGRVDEVINVAGHRLSTGAMEEVIAAHPDVAECAVIGVDDQLKGQLPLGFVVLKAGSDRDHGEVVRELVQMVRSEIGAVACFNKCVVVGTLPKTRSGKVLRGTMGKIADGKEYAMPSTIDDPTALARIEEAVAKIGYGRKARSRRDDPR